MKTKLDHLLEENILNLAIYIILYFIANYVYNTYVINGTYSKEFNVFALGLYTVMFYQTIAYAIGISSLLVISKFQKELSYTTYILYIALKIIFPILVLINVGINLM